MSSGNKIPFRNLLYTQIVFVYADNIFSYLYSLARGSQGGSGSMGARGSRGESMSADKAAKAAAAEKRRGSTHAEKKPRRPSGGGGGGGEKKSVELGEMGGKRKSGEMSKESKLKQKKADEAALRKNKVIA